MIDSIGNLPAKATLFACFKYISINCIDKEERTD